MNYGIIRNLLCKIMIMMACIMSVSLIFCVAYQESFKCYLAFLVPVGILLVLGWLLNIKKAKSKKMLAREGFVIVGLTWILMAAFGGIPFLIDGCMDNFLMLSLKCHQDLQHQVVVYLKVLKWKKLLIP